MIVSKRSRHQTLVAVTGIAVLAMASQVSWRSGRAFADDQVSANLTEVKCDSSDGVRDGRGQAITANVNGRRAPICVIGGDETSFSPSTNTVPKPESGKTYDAIVVGAGLAGMMAATYLSEDRPDRLREAKDRGLKTRSVMIIEKEGHLGGLAAAGSNDGVIYDRGAAYWTNLYPEEEFELRYIGMDPNKVYQIPEPIDSFYWDRSPEGLGLKNYSGIWDENTLGIKCPHDDCKPKGVSWDDDAKWEADMKAGNVLPMSFALFRDELQYRSKKGFVPNQPIEETDDEHLLLDTMDTATWIHRIPADFKAHRHSKKGTAIWRRFQREMAVRGLNETQMMDDVLILMNLYCRSALGTTADQVSAVAFANFYISEIIPRYTTSYGTGFAAKEMGDLLRDREKKGLVNISNSSAVVQKGIKKVGDHVEVTYLKSENGRTQTFVAKARIVIFAAQTFLAPKLIDGFPQDRVERINSMPYSHYSVHNFQVKGHPYRESYDTWMWWPGKSDRLFTDFINGLWLDEKYYPQYRHTEDGEKRVDGAPDERSFKKDPPGDGIYTIYHPIAIDEITPYNDVAAANLAKTAVETLASRTQPDQIDPRKPVGGWLDRSKIRAVPESKLEWQVESVRTSRWPFSVHVPRPGHFKDDGDTPSEAKLFRQPLWNGMVFFANNNLGTPAFEEALFRGHCAATNAHWVLDKREGTKFKRESWSHCPMDLAPPGEQGSNASKKDVSKYFPDDPNDNNDGK